MKFSFKISLLAATLGLFAACTSDDIVSQTNKKEGEVPVGVTFTIDEPKVNVNESASAKVTGGEQNAETRTSIKHTLNGGADSSWESDDFIWVKDKNGTWQKSIATTLKNNGASASFTLPGSVSDYTSGCEVRYTGNSNQPDQVNISQTRTQTSPNEFSKAGTMGDCGIGYATNAGGTNTFSFKLVHKAAYLCFLPRELDAALGANIYLTRVVITSDDAIAGNYSFSNTGLSSAPTSGASNVVTMTTKGTGAYANGFPLTNSTTSLPTNGAYTIIAPGTHNLTIQYYLYDPTTAVEGFIVKRIQGTFTANTVTPITANCNVTTVPLDSYYYWDAKQYAWHGNESIQPTTNGASANIGFTFQYGTQSTDPRAPREDTYSSGPAENSCKDCPNANEILWYIQRGDPHWDDNEIFAFGNHLHKGGMWLLKKDQISGFSSTVAPDGKNRSYHADGTWNDYFHNGENQIATPSTASLAIVDREKYFFLPAAGTYSAQFGGNATLENLGENAVWWGCDGLYGGAPHRTSSLIFSKTEIFLEADVTPTYRVIAPIWKVQ